MFTNREASFSALGELTLDHFRKDFFCLLLLLRWKDLCAQNNGKSPDEEKFPDKENWANYAAELTAILAHR